MKKQGAAKALQFIKNNYCMIASLETKSEEGCTDKVIAILEKHIKENCKPNNAQTEIIENGGENMNIVKCRFLKDGEPSGREYSYMANEELAVGDTVIAVTDRGEADLLVTQINIPESEVEAFKDRLKSVRKAEKPVEEVEQETVDLGF